MQTQPERVRSKEDEEAGRGPDHMRRRDPRDRIEGYCLLAMQQALNASRSARGEYWSEAAEALANAQLAIQNAMALVDAQSE